MAAFDDAAREAAREPPVWGHLDPGVRRYVQVLRENGVETFESCQGGPGHAFPDPTVRFHGDAGAGFQALAVAIRHDLPVLALHLSWSVYDARPHGPWWELVFRASDPVT